MRRAVFFVLLFLVLFLFLYVLLFCWLCCWGWWLFCICRSGCCMCAFAPRIAGRFYDKRTALRRSFFAVIYVPGLQDHHAGLLTGHHRLFVPQAGLHFADVAGADHQHAQTALADAAANGQGQLARQ